MNSSDNARTTASFVIELVVFSLFPSSECPPTFKEGANVVELELGKFLRRLYPGTVFLWGGITD